MGKLTKARRSLLQECADDERGMTGAVASYAPAKILVRSGLAGWLNGDPYSERLIITDAGRASLRKEPSENAATPCSPLPRLRRGNR